MAGVTCSLTINYDANGGSGSPARQIIVSQNVETFPKTISTTLRPSSPIRDGFTFLGWAQSSSASSPVYYPGGSYSYTFPYSTGSNQSVTITLYAVWRVNQYTVTYRPGTYGTGSQDVQTKYGGTDLTLRGRLYTRTGYNQVGWSTSAAGDSFSYALGGTYSANANIDLYPYWSIIKSTITSVTSSVPADGSTQGTVQINRPNAAFTHKVVVQLGTRTEEYTNVGTSCTFTIPAAWVDQIPESTSAVAKVLLYTYQNGSQVGSPDAKNFTVTVPDSIVPSVSLAYENLSDNATVDSWDTLVQGFSKIKLTATATAGTGSTIATVAFSGDGVSQSGTGTTVTSDLLVNSGVRTWTVTVTDKRGRTATATVTRTVHEYHTASIQSFSPFRSNISGADDPGTGTYITVTPLYSIASCDGHNSATVKKIEYKLNTASTWTVGQASATSGTAYTFGTISVLYAYNVRITVTDALGSTTVYESIVSAAIGFSFGMNGQCARLGGPVQYDDRLEVDFKAQFDDDVDVHGDLNVTGDINVQSLTIPALTVSGNLTLGNRQLMKSLWTGTWSSGDISVSGASDYTLFLIRAEAPLTSQEPIAILAMRAGTNLGKIRGSSGHAYYTTSYPNGRWTYWVSVAISGDTLTFENLTCLYQGDASFFRPAIIEIIGII